MTPPIAIVKHQLPGRLRLRIPARRGDISFFQGIVQALSKRPDIQELDANPLTGSILIHYSGSVQAITAAATEQGLFEVGPEHPKKAESAIPRANSGLLDTVATGLTGLALLQATQGDVAGNAAENFWNAYGAQRILGRPEIAAGFALLGIVQVLRGRLLGSAASLLYYSLITRQLASVDRAATRSGHSEAAPANAPADRPTS